MALSFDGPNKIISLTSGTTVLGVRDLWSRWVDWMLTSDNSKYLPAMEQVGGNDIDTVSGTYIPIYAFLKNGWKIKPQEASHTLNVNDGILLVDGGGDPFMNTTGSYIVRINYQQPVQAITVATGGGGGGGGLTTEQAETLALLDVLTEDVDGIRFTPKALEAGTDNILDANLSTKNVPDTVGNQIRTLLTKFFWFENK